MDIVLVVLGIIMFVIGLLTNKKMILFFGSVLLIVVGVYLLPTAVSGFLDGFKEGIN